MGRDRQRRFEIGRGTADERVGRGPIAYGGVGSQRRWRRWLAARDEQETWRQLRAAVTSPADWPWLPFAMSYVWEARRGAHPVFADVRADQARLAATAQGLASR